MFCKCVNATNSEPFIWIPKSVISGKTVENPVTECLSETLGEQSDNNNCLRLSFQIEDIICYGIGSISECSNARLQMSFALHLAEYLRVCGITIYWQ